MWKNDQDNISGILLSYRVSSHLICFPKVLRMGSKRSKSKQEPKSPDQTPEQKIFAELSLTEHDFEIDCGGGKSFLNQQRIIWMKIRHKPSGKSVDAKRPTSKNGFDGQRLQLMRELLIGLKNKGV